MAKSCFPPAPEPRRPLQQSVVNLNRNGIKVPRPSQEKQEPGVIEVFKKYLPIKLKGLIDDFRRKTKDKRDLTDCSQDETRLGVRTISGKKIPLKGVKPEQKRQWSYKYY